MFKNGMRPVHPGEILREDYLVPLGMTAKALAKALNVPAARIYDIVRERRAVTADTAMRLARYFRDGFKSEGFNYSSVNDRFVECVLGYCRAHLADLQREQVSIEEGSGIRYPLMKPVDMYFWQIGSEEALRKKAEERKATKTEQKIYEDRKDF